MQQASRETMEKEVVTKEDGRILIYYRFRPTGPEASQTPSQEGESRA